MNNTQDRASRFNEIYENEVKPNILKYEGLRKEQHKFSLWLRLFMVIFFVLAFVATINLENAHAFSDGESKLVLLALSIPAMIIFMIDYNLNKAFVQKIKTEFMSSLLSAFGDISWQPNTDVISDAKLNESGLFPPFSKRKNDDEFVGMYKNVTFRISELDLTFYGSGSYKYMPESAFKGVVITFNTNKTIKSRAIIAKKGDITRVNTAQTVLKEWFFLVKIGILFLMASILKPLLLCVPILIAILLMCIIAKRKLIIDKVQLESYDLCKDYDVYSLDQIEARYLLTPSFVQRFLSLKDVFDTNDIKCSFFGDEIMFAISMDDNLFEIGALYKSLMDSSAIQKFYNELSSIYDMIDYFKLDEKTGL